MRRIQHQILKSLLLTHDAEEPTETHDNNATNGYKVILNNFAQNMHINIYNSIKINLLNYESVKTTRC